MLQLKLNVLSKCTRPQDLQPARDSIDSISSVVVRSAQIGTKRKKMTWRKMPMERKNMGNHKLTGKSFQSGRITGRRGDIQRVVKLWWILPWQMPLSLRVSKGWKKTCCGTNNFKLKFFRFAEKTLNYRCLFFLNSSVIDIIRNRY